MELEGLHLLLTYQCTFECDHCFVFGSPWQTGTMTMENIRLLLNQAKEAGSVEWIYFEGGEPFLYYQVMLAGINEAIRLGFKIGVVTNCYWATSKEDAFLWLSPLEGKLHDLSISSDLFHYDDRVSQQSTHVMHVAEQLKIPLGIICIEQPEITAQSSMGQLPSDSSSVMYRGRAAEKLSSKISPQPSSSFTMCPHENLRDPGRVHVDPFGNLHICQGISIGNVFRTPLKVICQEYAPDTHPILGPLLERGPIGLAEKYKIHYQKSYADACQMCFEVRKELRNKLPDILTPDQMYAEPG